MSRLRVLPVILGLLLGLGACTNEVLNPTPMVNATVQLVDVEGGCWVITTAGGERYQPTNLTAAFQQDGLAVVVSFVTRNDLGSVCMVGEMIELTSIRLY